MWSLAKPLKSTCPNRDVERRSSYSTLSDLSPSISNEVSVMNSFSINFPTRNPNVVQMTILGTYSVFFEVYSAFQRWQIYSVNSKQPAQDISEGTNVRSLLIGLATTALAGLCFTGGNTMVKLLPPGSSYDILLLRSLIQVQLVVIYSCKCCFLKYVTILFKDATHASSADPCRQWLLWCRRPGNEVS